MSEGIVYLGLCVRFQPPIIGIHYKNREKDPKKKIYTILLQKLVLNPNAEEVAEQLYAEHAHILKESKIPFAKIVGLVRKIQQELKIGDDENYPEDYEEHDEHEHEEQEEEEDDSMQYHQPPKEQPKQNLQQKFKFAENDFGNDDGPLNRSL